MIHAPITRLQSQANDPISIGDEDIVVFIGPNNVGKSRMLAELHAQYVGQRRDFALVDSISLDRRGSEEDLLSWLKSNCRWDEAGQATKFSRLGNNVLINDARESWDSGSTTIQRLGGLLSYMASTEHRLQLTHPPDSFDPLSQAPSHPVHYMELDESLEREISNYFWSAFREELVVERGGGSRRNVFVGERPALEAGENYASPSYLRRVRTLPALHFQGDGMRSYAGCLFASIATHTLVTFIDEPDLFLHPPQARTLGRQLAESKPQNKQLFLSTHNGNFLRGLLDAGASRLRIIRITREAERNQLNELPPEEIHRVWKDPALRHTNMLDGLFYEKVVLCEGDSDCRFYQWALQEKRERSSTVGADMLFVPCGGKARMAQVATSLRTLGTPVVAIVDFDIFNDENHVTGIVKALGGSVDEIVPMVRQIRAHVEQQTQAPTIYSILNRVSEMFQGRQGDAVAGREDLRGIQRIVSDSKVWGHAKRYGGRIIPPGTPQQTYEALRARLEHAGVYVLDVGELEGFCRSAGGKGARWIDNVLADPGFREEAYSNACALTESLDKAGS